MGTHGTNISTKGIISGKGQIVSSFGYVVDITVEEITAPVSPKKGRASSVVRKSKKIPKGKKLIVVTATINGQKYIESKYVEKDRKVTTKDIDIIMGEKPKIVINFEKK